jgi:hypothetical protein
VFSWVIHLEQKDKFYGGYWATHSVGNMYMNRFRSNLFLFITTTFSLYSLPVAAGNSASATISVGGDIVAPLSMAIDEGVRFGGLAADSSTGSTVRVAVTDQSSGAFSISNATGSGAVTGSFSRGPGKITVTGEPNYHYSATAANAGFATVTPARGISMQVETFSGTRVLGSGTDSFYLGGTMTIPPNAVVGEYTGTVAITVTYD